MAYNYLDKEGLQYLWSKIKARFADKSSIPTKVSQLTNDSEYQTKTQVQDAITYAMPTKVSQLTNDSGYQNASQVNSAIASAIAGIETISFEIVSTLPTTGKSATIYLVANNGGSHDEYIYINNRWEKLGTTDIDLSGYVQSSELVKITNSEIDAIVAS